MSRIDDLIEEHCSGGVPFKTLGEVGTFVRGNGLQKKDLTNEGVGAIHYGQVFTTYGTATMETKSFVDPAFATRLRKAKAGDLVIATTSENDADVCKAVAWLGESEIAISGDAFVYQHSLDPLYMAFYFQTEAFQSQKRKFISGTKVKRVSGADLARITIPIPPLAIQREIATILDQMESLKAKLESQLESELELRSRQYAFHRDSLLTFAEIERVRWATLNEISTNLDAQRRPVTKSARQPGSIPYYGASGIVDYVSDYIFDGDYLLVSEDGANLVARSSPIAFSASGQTWINNHAHVLEFPTYAERRFVEIYLNSIDLSPYLTGAAQPKLNQANLNKIPIPVPDLNEQERIVAILDKFGALVNDLSIVLPAEIAARRRQYEYYRDKLLTFEEQAA